MILMRYLWRNVMWSIFFTLLILLGLFSFFDFLSQLRQVGENGYRVSQAATMVLLNMPAALYQLLPIAALIGGLFALSQLEGSSELTIYKASGISSARLLSWLALLGAILAVLVFVLGEWVTPYSQRAAQQLEWQSKHAGVNNLAENQQGVWLRQENALISIEQILPQGQLRGVQIIEISPDFSLRTMLNAETAQAFEQYWLLEKASRTDWRHPNALKISQHPQLKWQTSLTPKFLQQLATPAEALSLRALSQYIQHLKQNHQQAAPFIAAFWSKALYPLLSVVMLLLALPFSAFNKRAGGAGAQIVLGSVIGLSFYFLNQLFNYMSLRYGVVGLFSSLLPIALYAGLGAWALYRQEKR